MAPPPLKTCTTPPGLTPIMTQIPRKAESFSSLSRMLRREVHLGVRGQRSGVRGSGVRGEGGGGKSLKPLQKRSP